MRTLVIACSLVALVGCQGAPESQDGASDIATPPAVAAGINADTLLSEVERLSSDEFEGRAPGSDGGPALSTT